MRLLQDHALFRTRDLDEARERVAAVFCPHRQEADGPVEACHHHMPGHDLGGRDAARFRARRWRRSWRRFWAPRTGR